MTPTEQTIIIKLKRRSFVGRVAYLPKAFREHYKIFRRKNGVLPSLRGAWIMSGLLIKPIHRGKP